MTRKRLRYASPLAAAALLVALAACQSQEAGTGEFPRDETVFTTGTEWGTYSNWNPLQGGGQATYVRGVIYETLFMFDPWTQELEPWLAEGGEWVADDTYEIRVREGVQWHDGEAFTAEDVVFTIELRHIEPVPYHALNDWVDTVELVDDYTVRVTFSDPRRGEWDNWLYNNHMVPEHHWAELATQPDDNGVEGGMVIQTNAEDIIVGTGPVEYHSHSEDRAAYERFDGWWATEQLGHEIRPRYIVDFKNQSNDVVIPQLINGEIDLSNNFIPGVNLLPEYGDTVHTFYAEPPHMIPANTAYLLPNNERPPMDDAEFRRALAFSVDVDAIVDNVYEGIVQPSHDSGLLGIWEEYYDDATVADHGFGHDPAQAESILDAAGYDDTDGDGLRETPDGDPIELSLIVPSGWNDFEQAAEVISEGARAVGIDVQPDTPDASELDDLRDSGEYDLVINNESGLSNTPAEHFQYLFRLPVRDVQEARDNMHRYENERAWELTQQLWGMSVGDPGFAEVVAELQEIALTEMPAIPMWYNGLWSQVNDTVWTNWPSGDPDTPDYYPNTWNGVQELKAFLTFSEIRPAG